MKKLALVMLIFPVPGIAEPGATTQELMNEPASIFDIGMLRLDHWASESTSNYAFQYATAATSKPMEFVVHPEYSRTSDKINIHVVVYDETATEAQAKAGCNEALTQISYHTSKRIPGSFLHVGRDTDRDEFNALRSALLDMIVLNCVVMDMSSNVRVSVSRGIPN